MKIVCISDTHGMYDRIELPAGDVLIHAGDIMGRGTIVELARFAEWLGTLSYEKIIVVPGNHDACCEMNPSLSREMVSMHATYLVGEETEVRGLKVWGGPWQPEFMDWYFNLPRGEKLKERWDQIPDDTDILITHGPPHGTLDDVIEGGNVGCEELTKAVARVRPKLHVFGHIHHSYGQTEVDGTTFVNASICTEQYRPTNAPIVVEL